MKTQCPTCGADVEFRYDDSFVRVCDSCRAAVLRTDRSVESLGKVADLVPIDSPLTLFAEGKYDGDTFILVGLAQIKHTQGGVWQEWYAKFSGDRWGWLAEAQGRFYLTFETNLDAGSIPRFEALVPARTLDLGIDGKPVAFAVGERGDATYISATGEIPYRLEPNATLRYVDLSGKAGEFATIDFTEPADPTVYVGRQVTLKDLGITGGEVMPARQSRAPASRVACPNCDGSLELRAPDQTLRVGCPFCNHLIDVSSGNLAVIGKLAVKAVPSIPLGATGTFLDGELTVIGYMQRSAYVDGNWWPFHEYLLYKPEIGFRWLVCSDSHWSYVQPVAPGAITPTVPVTYDGQTFTRYSAAYLRVDAVYGEFYWQVQAGELVESEDFIAPPAMLSRESTGTESSYSLSTYMTPGEIKFAFAKDAKAKDIFISDTRGVGANQPYPLRGWNHVAIVAVVVLAVLGIGKCANTHPVMLASHTMTVSSGPSTLVPEATASVEFTEPFHVAAGKNLELEFKASSLSNNWIYAAVDLVDETTGQVISIDKNLEYYEGYEDGESWNEGDRSDYTVIGPIPEGQYVLRVEAQQGSITDTTLTIDVRQGVFRSRYWFLALLILGIPFGAIALHARGFQRKRDENSNPYAVNPTSPVTRQVIDTHVPSYLGDDDE